MPLEYYVIYVLRILLYSVFTRGGGMLARGAGMAFGPFLLNLTTSTLMMMDGTINLVLCTDNNYTNE